MQLDIHTVILHQSFIGSFYYKIYILFFNYKRRRAEIFLDLIILHLTSAQNIKLANKFDVMYDVKLPHVKY